MTYPKPSDPDYCPGSGSIAVTGATGIPGAPTVDPCPYCGRHVQRRVRKSDHGAPIGPRHPHLRTVPRTQRFPEAMRAEPIACAHMHQTSVPGVFPLVIVCTDCHQTIPERNPR